MKQTVKKPKKKYIKPEIKKEPLVTFGAVCNGSSNAGRKSFTAPPSSCNAAKLLS